MPTVGVFAAIFDEDGRILCVQRGYGDFGWTTPGGALDPGESPIDCLRREVREETGLLVEPGPLIGIYSAPFKDDLVLFFHATVNGAIDWRPDGEISQFRYFDRSELPQPMTERAAKRIDDAFQGRSGVLHVFAPSPMVQTGSSKQRDRACGALILNGHILMVRHREAERVYWTLPGGGIEDGETPEEAAVREMFEETGFRTRVVRLLHESKGPERTEYMFLMADVDPCAAESRPDIGVGYDPEEIHLDQRERMLQGADWRPLEDVKDDCQVSVVLRALAERH